MGPVTIEAEIREMHPQRVVGWAWTEKGGWAR